MPASSLAVLVGALAGLAGGLAHVRLRIPSFIATLAVGGVLAGTALVISQARSITLDEAQRGSLAWVSDTSFGIPHEIFIGAVVLLGAHLLQSRTRFGRYSAAIGAGEAAAYASGVKVGRQKVLALTLSGAFAGSAGVILAGRLSSGSPTLANELLLPAIAAVVVGGTAITGGVGSIWRTADRCPDHLGGADRHDLRRRQHLRAADRVRPRADPGRRHHHRPQQDPDREIEGSTNGSGSQGQGRRDHRRQRRHRAGGGARASPPRARRW